MANLLYQTLQPVVDEDVFGTGADAYGGMVGLNSADESLPYNTSELNAPEYSTDDFRMYSFKVARCSKRYVHDWRACPFAHPTENARRRDPRLVSYLPIPCPDYKRGICMRGDTCPYSHGVYECWLHPAKYRTQLCKEGPHCRRPVCFFAHSVMDLRQPSHVPQPALPEVEVPQGTAAASLVAAISATVAAQQQQQAHAQQQAQQAQQAAQQAQQAAQQAQQTVALAAALQSAGSVGSRASLGDEGAASQRIMAEEAMNNLQDGRSSSGSAGAGGSPQDSPSSPSAGRAALSPAPSAALSCEAAGSSQSLPALHSNPATPSRLSGQDLPAQQPSLEAPSLVSVAAQLEAHAAAAASNNSASRLSVDSLPGVQAGPRYSLDSRLTLEQAAAAAAALGQPRMSMDSALAGGARGSPSTAAAALAAAGSGGLPLNEQPFPPSGAPRMSNAVARKLGLAPQKSAAEARLAKMRAAAAAAGLPGPGRASLDGLLQALHTSQRPSFEQQMMAGMNPQMLAATGLGQMNGGYPNGAGPAPYGDPGAINPALLSLVAANMGGPAPMMPPGPHNGIPKGPSGNDAAVAALLSSINEWQLGGGNSAPASAPGSARPSYDASAAMAAAAAAAAQQQAAAAYLGGHSRGSFDARPSFDARTSFDGRASYDSRASFEGCYPGMLPPPGVPAGLALQQMQAAAAAAGHQGPYYLPSDLDAMVNNNRGQEAS